MYNARIGQPAAGNRRQGGSVGAGDFEGEYERRGKKDDGEI